jgi:hypothetical protein
MYPEVVTHEIARDAHEIVPSDSDAPWGVLDKRALPLY